MHQYVEFLTKMADRVNRRCEPAAHDALCAVSLRGLAQIRHQLPCFEPEARNFQTFLFFLISKPLLGMQGGMPLSEWLIKALVTVDAHEASESEQTTWAMAGLHGLASGMEATEFPDKPVSTQTLAAIERSRAIGLTAVRELQRLHDEALLKPACA
ncbi:hypothetical protein [Streptomyces sp. NPDC089919]|uniref:hypothetical protein n=1 Tax=Streptomyces sp. NPDC089919 TaxID=3155188 RepID=UPI00342D061F